MCPALIWFHFPVTIHLSSFILAMTNHIFFFIVKLLQTHDTDSCGSWPPFLSRCVWFAFAFSFLKTGAECRGVVLRMSPRFIFHIFFLFVRCNVSENVVSMAVSTNGQTLWSLMRLSSNCAVLTPICSKTVALSDSARPIATEGAPLFRLSKVDLAHWHAHERWEPNQAWSNTEALCYPGTVLIDWEE